MKIVNEYELAERILLAVDVQKINLTDLDNTPYAKYQLRKIDKHAGLDTIKAIANDLLTERGTKVWKELIENKLDAYGTTLGQLRLRIALGNYTDNIAEYTSLAIQILHKWIFNYFSDEIVLYKELVDAWYQENPDEKDITNETFIVTEQITKDLLRGNNLEKYITIWFNIDDIDKKGEKWSDAHHVWINLFSKFADKAGKWDLPSQIRKDESWKNSKLLKNI